MKKRLSPYGGIIRIRFNGSDLSHSAPLSKRRQRYVFLDYLPEISFFKKMICSMKKNYFCNL